MKNKLKYLIGLGLGFIGGFLGAWAGASGTDKAWRRILIPGICTVYAILNLFGLYKFYSFWCITMMSMAGVFSMGYGIPSSTDSGSDLGQFWYHIWNKNHFLADLFTRGTIGVILCISILSVPILKGNWLTYWLCSLGIIVTYANVSWRDLGGFYFKNKYLLWSDFITYGLVVTLISFLIK